MPSMEKDYYIFVYGTERLPVGLDVIDDEIFRRIEGQGEVFGTGTGIDGWNLDLHFESAASRNFVLRETVNVLLAHGLSDGVSFDINGTRVSLSELESHFGGAE